MSGDCLSIALITAALSAEKPRSASVYPMRRIVSRAMSGMSTQVSVEISPETTTSPVFTRVSQATRPFGSSFMTASSTPSEIWSATLSGWPSVTDSEVNRYSLSESFSVAMSRKRVSTACAP